MDYSVQDKKLLEPVFQKSVTSLKLPIPNYVKPTLPLKPVQQMGPIANKSKFIGKIM